MGAEQLNCMSLDACRRLLAAEDCSQIEGVRDSAQDLLRRQKRERRRARKKLKAQSGDGARGLGQGAGAAAAVGDGCETEDGSSAKKHKAKKKKSRPRDPIGKYVLHVYVRLCGLSCSISKQGRNARTSR